MEGVKLEYFKSYNIVIYFNSYYESYSYVSEENKKYVPDEHVHMTNPCRKLMYG